MTAKSGLHLYNHGGELVQLIPDSIKGSSVAFHPDNANILAIGFDDGSVRVWDIEAQAYVSLIKEYDYRITNIRFASDNRLFLTSWDNKASIVYLDSVFQSKSCIKLKGHKKWVNDIVRIPFSDMCVTGSVDATIKVWDCKKGKCLRTLTKHTIDVVALAVHSREHVFASGSVDRTVVIWSSDTFEALHQIQFPNSVQSLEFSNFSTLYVGVYNHGVMSSIFLKGELDPTVITPLSGYAYGLKLGNERAFPHLRYTRS